MSVHAKMTVVVEVDCGGGAWQDTESLSHIYKTAEFECTNFLQTVLRDRGEKRIRVVGKPVVTAIILPQAAK